MANEVVGIDIVAKVDGLKAELSRLAPGMEKEAKAMVAALEKELKRAEKAAKAAAAESRKAGDGFKSVGDNAGKAGQSAAKLAGALSLVSPEAAEAARSIADLADVGEVGAEAGGALGVSLTAAGVAVAALSAAAIAGYGVWNYYAAAERAAAEAAENLRTTLDAVAPVASRIADARLEEARATGQLTDAEYGYERAVQAAASARDADIKKTLEAKGVTEAHLASVRLLMDGTGQYSQALAQADQTAVQAAIAVAAINTGYEQQTAALARTRDATEAKRQSEERARKSAEALAEATRKAAEVERSAAAEQRAADDRLAAELKRTDELTAGIDRLAAMRAESSRAGQEGEAALDQALTDRLSTIREITSETLKLAQTDAEANAIIKAGAASSTAAQQAYLRELDAVRSESAQAESDRIEELRKEQLQAYEDIISAMADVFDSAATFADLEYEKRAERADATAQYLADNEATLTAAQKAELEARLANQQEKAREAFEIGQAVQVAGALANTALAIVNALATVPYPAAPFVAAAAGVAGAAQVATILATEPSFHTGGGVSGQGGMYPDERRVKALTGETVVDRVSTASAGGPEGVRAALKGGNGGTTLRIGRLEAREIVRTDLRSGGLIPQEVRKVVSRNGRRVGLSGRGVIA